MKMKLFYFFLFSFSFISLNSQVVFHEELNVEKLMARFMEKNSSDDEILAWKIQLITTNDRRKMEATRSKFNSLYPKMKLNWKHESPYYHVQIGAYRRKLDLQYFLMSLKEDFPTAIPVLEKISKKELLNNS